MWGAVYVFVSRLFWCGNRRHQNRCCCQNTGKQTTQVLLPELILKVKLKIFVNLHLKVPATVPTHLYKYKAYMAVFQEGILLPWANFYFDCFLCNILQSSVPGNNSCWLLLSSMECERLHKNTSLICFRGTFLMLWNSFIECLHLICFTSNMHTFYCLETGAFWVFT